MPAGRQSTMKQPRAPDDEVTMAAQGMDGVATGEVRIERELDPETDALQALAL